MAPHNLGDGVAARQSILDSAMHLMSLRRRVLDDLSRQGKTPGGELVGVDADLGAWAMEQSHTWRHLLSTRPVTSAADLSRSMPNNRLALAGGLRMTSVFDRHGTDAGARRILEREPEGAYFFSHAPLEMRVIDQRMVWLAGPQEPRSILHLTSAQALDAAMKTLVCRAGAGCPLPGRGVRRLGADTASTSHRRTPPAGQDGRGGQPRSSGECANRPRRGRRSHGRARRALPGLARLCLRPHRHRVASPDARDERVLQQPAMPCSPLSQRHTLTGPTRVHNRQR